VSRLSLLYSVILLGCDATPYEIDSFAVGLDPSAPVPVLWAAAGDETPVPVVMDTGAPLTILDADEPTRTRAPLTLFGTSASGLTPRARFLSTAFLRRRVHAIGPEPGGTPTVPISGIVAGDVLATLAVRFDMPARQIHFFTDVATDDDRFYQEGHAVIRASPSGGGVFELEGGIVRYPASRMVLPTCLEQRDLPFDVSPKEDAMLVLATGFDRLVLTASAYTRARRTAEPDYQPDFRFDQPYHVPGGSAPVMVDLEELARLALIDDEHENRGGCEELWLNRLMSARACGLSCRCPDGSSTCPAGSTVELIEPIAVAVIEDADPLLHAIREELRPRHPDIDGFLGGGLLHGAVFDVDYPHSRVVLRCRDEACRTVPRVEGDE
jgi:hypothetical protein